MFDQGKNITSKYYLSMILNDIKYYYINNIINTPLL